MHGHRVGINSLPLQWDEYEPQAMTEGFYAINTVMYFHQVGRRADIIPKVDALSIRASLKSVIMVQIYFVLTLLSYGSSQAPAGA